MVSVICVLLKVFRNGVFSASTVVGLSENEPVFEDVFVDGLRFEIRRTSFNTIKIICGNSVVELSKSNNWVTGWTSDPITYGEHIVWEAGLDGDLPE